MNRLFGMNFNCQHVPVVTKCCAMPSTSPLIWYSNVPVMVYTLPPCLTKSPATTEHALTKSSLASRPTAVGDVSLIKSIPQPSFAPKAALSSKGDALQQPIQTEFNKVSTPSVVQKGPSVGRTPPIIPSNQQNQSILQRQKMSEELRQQHLQYEKRLLEAQELSKAEEQKFMEEYNLKKQQHLEHQENMLQLRFLHLQELAAQHQHLMNQQEESIPSQQHSMIAQQAHTQSMVQQQQSIPSQQQQQHSMIAQPAHTQSMVQQQQSIPSQQQQQHSMIAQPAHIQSMVQQQHSMIAQPVHTQSMVQQQQSTPSQQQQSMIAQQSHSQSMVQQLAAQQEQIAAQQQHIADQQYDLAKEQSIIPLENVEQQQSIAQQQQELAAQQIELAEQQQNIAQEQSMLLQQSIAQQQTSAHGQSMVDQQQQLSVQQQEDSWNQLLLSARARGTAADPMMLESYPFPLYETEVLQYDSDWNESQLEDAKQVNRRYGVLKETGKQLKDNWDRAKSIGGKIMEKYEKDLWRQDEEEKQRLQELMNAYFQKRKEILKKGVELVVAKRKTTSAINKFNTRHVLASNS